MSGRSVSFKNSILASVFNSNANIYIRLYTDVVALSDSVLGTEVTVTGYPVKGIAVMASSANFSVVDNVAENIVDISFPECTSGEETVRYFAIWSDNVSDAESARLYWGQLSEDILLVSGITLTFTAGYLTITEN